MNYITDGTPVQPDYHQGLWYSLQRVHKKIRTPTGRIHLDWRTNRHRCMAA